MEPEAAHSNDQEELISLKNENETLRSEVEQLKANSSDIAKTEYQNSQTRFRAIFEYSRLGNKVITADLKIVQVNPAMVALLGYTTKEELIEHKFLIIRPKRITRIGNYFKNSSGKNLRHHLAWRQP